MRLEEVVVPLNHSLVFKQDKEITQSYWGYDSSKCHIIIYNTKEPEIINDYIFQACLQYSLHR